jgi:hypothetical protein
MKSLKVLSLGVLLVAASGAGAVEVFRADFENSTVQESTTIANVNAGTAIGTWSDLPDGVVMATTLHGLHVRLHDPALGGTGNKALLFDRFDDRFTNTGGNANFSQTIPRDGAVIEFGYCSYRTQGNTHDKDVRITGRDAAGNKSFELVISTVNGNSTAFPGEELRIAYMAPGDVRTMVPQGAPLELTGGGGAALAVADPATFAGIKITCGPYRTDR